MRNCTDKQSQPPSTPHIGILTHWGRVMHICVGILTSIGSDNGLSPGRCQAIIWTNAPILLIGPLGTNFSEILAKIITFSFKKMYLKVSSAKRRPFCLGLNVLTKTKVFCTSDPNLLILAWTGPDEFWHRQAKGWCIHTHTDAGNNNTWGPKLSSGTNTCTSLRKSEGSAIVYHRFLKHPDPPFPNITLCMAAIQAMAWRRKLPSRASSFRVCGSPALDLNLKVIPLATTLPEVKCR